MANFATTDLLGDPSQASWQQQNLVTVTAPNGQKWQVYREAAPAFQAFLQELSANGYNPTSSGGFNYRNIRGSNRLSQHAFGAAIDINAAANPMGGTTSDMPADVGAIAAKYGIEWGGNWTGRKDPMHFEWTGKGYTPQTNGLAQTQPQQQQQQTNALAPLPQIALLDPANLPRNRLRA